MYVLESTQDVNRLALKTDPSLGGIFDREFCLAVLARYSTNSARQMIPIKKLDITNLEGLDEQVVEPQ